MDIAFGEIGAFLRIINIMNKGVPVTHPSYCYYMNSCGLVPSAINRPNLFPVLKHPQMPFATPNSMLMKSLVYLMLILHSLARHPQSCRYVCTPSKIRICVKPISRINSSLACSESVGKVFVTRNMVVIRSCVE